MDKTNDGDVLTLKDDTVISLHGRTWKDAFKNKAFYLSATADSSTTKGYCVIWYLWSADVWFGRFPLLKFILAVNVVVWILQFVF